ncbi:hypothetical protein [Microvirga solisilvae]|uniref:hypothetical protein n=1 Tax=Microvirga solisilvae TaxID=2919498 RepID=UPI001FAFF8B1|nr:hypothetical protein [Microvirga solisilvae]
MIKLGIAASFMALSIIHAAAQEPLLIVKAENLLRDPKWAYVHFSVLNNSNRAAEAVYVACTFFDNGGEPLETVTGAVLNVKPGEKAIGKIHARYKVEMETVKCRLNEAVGLPTQRPSL